MIQKIKNAILILVTMAMTAVPAVAVVPSTVAFAACSNIGNQISSGANGAANNGDQTSTCDSATGTTTNDISAVASKIVNVFSIIVGAISIIMIIYGGFRYITSGGASERVGNAKNTLLYAIIGLIIVALAQLIVHFVLNFTSSNVTSTT